MAQPDHVELADDITAARKGVKRIVREAEEVNRVLARLQDAEQKYTEVVRAAYGIDIQRKETA